LQVGVVHALFYSSLEFGVVRAYHRSCDLCIIFTSTLLQFCFIILNHCWSHELHIVKSFCKLVLLICCSYSSLELIVVRAYDQSYELRTSLISALLQVDYIVHDYCWNRELDVVKTFCKLVLFMHCFCSSLDLCVVLACHRSCEPHTILIFALLQVGFVVHSCCWSCELHVANVFCK